MRKRNPSRLHLLSVREVQTAGDGDHVDGGGLILRVRDRSATWVLRYTSAAGNRREMGLGTAHRANAAQAGQSVTGARDLAAKARLQLQQGVDPIDERARMKSDARQQAESAKARREREIWTLAKCARDYHERVIEPSRTEKHAAQWITSLENHMPPALWNKPIEELRAPELLAALTAIRPHERARNLKGDDRVPETTRRIRQRLDAVFEDAIFHGRCSSNPAAAIRRKMREAMPRKQAGQFAALPYREAPAFMRQLRGMEGIAARCLELALLCAARTSEALLAQWSEFDLDAKVWLVPAERMKAKEPHVVYLAPAAMELVKRMRGLDDSLVFPAPNGNGKPLSNMALLAVLGRMGARKRTTVHGLCRATFSTWANETAAARPDVIEACLAHEEANRVRASYNRAEFAKERAELLSAWAKYLGSWSEQLARVPRVVSAASRQTAKRPSSSAETSAEAAAEAR
jgi:integrase